MTLDNFIVLAVNNPASNGKPLKDKEIAARRALLTWIRRGR